MYYAIAGFLSHFFKKRFPAISIFLPVIIWIGEKLWGAYRKKHTHTTSPKKPLKP